MDSSRKSALAGGVVLILIGLAVFVINFIPGMNLSMVIMWPFFVIGAGAALLVLGLLLGVPDMAVPATIVAGIGGILYIQNLTHHWESWSYAWALIPIFVGLGMLVARTLGGGDRYPISEALGTISTGLVLFVIFGAFFGAFGFLGNYWPLLLVAAGLLLILRPLFRRRKQ